MGCRKIGYIREQERKHKQHIKNLADNCQGYPSPAYPVDKHGNRVPDNEWYIWFPEDEKREFAYYKRQYRGKRSKYLKKLSNRKIRRYEGELHNGYHCHRLFDFWWELD